MDLKPRILAYLKTQEEPIPTLDLAKAMGMGTCKDINPILYSLLSSKQVEKITEGRGRNPRWCLSDQGKVREELLSLLEKAKEPLSPGEIRQGLTHLLSKSELNSLLYSLQKEELVTKMANENGSQPKWALF